MRSLSDDVERTASDMLVAPLDHQHVVARLTESVLDDVLEIVHVNDAQLFTRHARPRDTDHQHVVPCTTHRHWSMITGHCSMVTGQ